MTDIAFPLMCLQFYNNLDFRVFFFNAHVRIDKTFKYS